MTVPIIHQFHMRTDPPASAVGKPIMTIAFDGTLHSYVSGWQGAEVIADAPVKDAMLFLTNTTEKFEVHIHSIRTSHPGGAAAMYDWLNVHLCRYWADRPDMAAKVLSRLKFPNLHTKASTSGLLHTGGYVGTHPTVGVVQPYSV